MLYDPDPAAIPVGTAFTRQLSPRDLGLQIPVNYVTTAGVALTPACFPQQRYDDVSTVRCFSNLLAIGFDRFVVDTYWDATRQTWNLCPVELGKPVTPASTKGSSTPASSSSAGSLAANVEPRQLDSHGVNDADSLEPRQESTSTSINPSPASSATHLKGLPSITATTTLSPTGVSRANSDGKLFKVGPYSCTSSINLSLLFQILDGHLDNTQFRQNATLKYLTLNLHAAAPVSNPKGSANTPAPSNLPSRGNLLSSVIPAHLKSYLYTPEALRLERAGLNASSSWYGQDDSEHEPDSTYFNIKESDGHSFTLNGWPSGSFIEMEDAKRLLVEYGEIDQQLQAYDFKADADTIFPQRYLQSRSQATISEGGEVENGCFYQAGTFSLQNVNSSWATYTNSNNDDASTKDLTTGATNLIDCGISPFLNTTLNSKSADQDFTPYQNYVQSTIWSWDDGEPSNDTSSKDDMSTRNRCAVLSSTSGRWQSEDCNNKHRSACRNPNSIYEWTISSSTASYLHADSTCPSGTLFTVPHTALENTYLVHAFRNSAGSDKDELLWLNFNSLSAANCWVIGQNETCPYLPDGRGERAVLVPTIAAIIVFILAALTIFVKCTSNRQQAKRRRRRGAKDDAGDYEGVPS